MLNNYQLALLLVIFCLSADMVAQEKNDPFPTLEAGCEATSEFQITQSGDRNFANLLRLNASFSMPNITLEAGSLSTYMTADGSIGEDMQTFSNLDADNIPFALSMLDICWRIDDRQSLFLGIRNMNEDYFTSEVTSFFTNSSCGIYPTISANYSVANYPMASVGVHYSYFADQWGFQASLYNGQGYNHLTGHDNVFRFRPSQDGIFGLVQAEYSSDGRRYFLGSSIHSNYDDGVTPWFYTEQRLNDIISLIAGYSHAFGEDVDCSDFVGVGAHFKLRHSEWGVFSDYSRFVDCNEFATEVTCTIPIGEYLYVQPVAHIINTDKQWSSAYCVRIGLQL